MFIPRHTESLDYGPQQDGLLTGVLQQLLKCQGPFSSLCLSGEEKTRGLGTFEWSSFLDHDVHVYFVIQFTYHLVTLVVMCHLPGINILVPFYQDGWCTRRLSDPTWHWVCMCKSRLWRAPCEQYFAGHNLCLQRGVPVSWLWITSKKGPMCCGWSIIKIVLSGRSHCQSWPILQRNTWTPVTLAPPTYAFHRCTIKWQVLQSQDLWGWTLWPKGPHFYQYMLLSRDM